MFDDPTKKFDSAFLSNYYYYTKKLVCLWNGRLNCWSLYIMTGFSWSLCIMTGFSWSLYIMTEMTAVRIYNDWFRIRTITDIYLSFYFMVIVMSPSCKRIVVQRYMNEICHYFKLISLTENYFKILLSKKNELSRTYVS